MCFKSIGNRYISRRTLLLENNAIVWLLHVCARCYCEAIPMASFPILRSIVSSARQSGAKRFPFWKASCYRSCTTNLRRIPAVRIFFICEGHRSVNRQHNIRCTKDQIQMKNQEPSWIQISGWNYMQTIFTATP